MSISSCSDKTIRIQTPPDPAKSPEHTRRLPTYSRAERYSFPDPDPGLEEVAEAMPDIAPVHKKTPSAKAVLL
ncbi:hypothetical protein [Pseudomonas sp. OTU5201]|uniref:hypothetical protein n=1 Tax=Pseudomonas sp. OTU5201 TaxID=3043850 RepID=UPI00313BE153